MEQPWQIWGLRREHANTFHSSSISPLRGKEEKCQHAGCNTRKSGISNGGTGAGGTRSQKVYDNPRRQRRICGGAAWASRACRKRRASTLRAKSSALPFINWMLPRFLCPDVTVILNLHVTTVCLCSETLNRWNVHLDTLKSRQNGALLSSWAPLSIKINKHW